VSVSAGHDIYRLRETLGAKSASMADVELMALTTEAGVHHRTVTRGHGVSDGAGLTFCGEAACLTPFFGAPFRELPFAKRALAPVFSESG